MRRIDKLIIHCSESDFGDAALIKKWHTDPRPAGNGWTDIGYHFVVLNGFRKKRIYVQEDDGKIEAGLPVERQGAHCWGHNKTSIGVCLIGKRLFSAKQLYDALPEIIRMTGTIHNFELKGHYEYSDKKSCPNIDMDMLRKLLRKGGL